MNDTVTAKRPFLGGSYKRKQMLGSIVGFLFRFAFVIGACFLILQPLLTKVSISFMSVKDVYDQTVKVIPKEFTLSNYSDAVVITRFWGNLARTFVLCMIISLTQTFSCTLVGYGFARFKFKGSGLLFVLVIICMVVPVQVILIPQYLNFNMFGLVGGYWPFFCLGLTATGARCGLYIYLVRQFFRGIPREVDEAAAIDGAGPFKTFFLIMLRSALSIMVTVFLFSFVWQWGENSYTFIFYAPDTLAKMLGSIAYAFAQKQTAGTVSVVSAADQMAFQNIVTATTTLMCIIPLLVLYLFSQRFFIQSIERTGIVG
ncbi:MAG: carbohydrate ABC transporter permease [Clostridia bacterium]|nr:carbohydrate ABC transporter permease [Clostridia bacterium]